MVLLKDILRQHIGEAYDNSGFKTQEAFKEAFRKGMRDFYEERIEPVIKKRDSDLFEACDRFMLYKLCREVCLD